MLGFNSHSLVEKQIDAMKPGEVFSINDFEDLGSAKTISKILGRLCDEGVCEKVMRGVFWKSDGTQPHTDRLARAIARSNRWNAVSCGDTALHVLGIEEEQPSEWTYLTNNGTYRKYSVNGMMISFKRVTSKVYGEISKETAQMVQFLKATGKRLVPTGKAIRKINDYFTKEEKDVISRESSGLSGWLRKTISLVFLQGSARHPEQEFK